MNGRVGEQGDIHSSSVGSVCTYGRMNGWIRVLSSGSFGGVQQYEKMRLAFKSRSLKLIWCNTKLSH